LGGIKNRFGGCRKYLSYRYPRFRRARRFKINEKFENGDLFSYKTFFNAVIIINKRRFYYSCRNNNHCCSKRLLNPQARRDFRDGA